MNRSMAMIDDSFALVLVMTFLPAANPTGLASGQAGPATVSGRRLGQDVPVTHITWLALSGKPTGLSPEYPVPGEGEANRLSRAMRLAHFHSAPSSVLIRP